MMLATRCPYCRTMFRVVQDQLKICNGIVRCGSCRQVFNGIEQLQSADAAAQAMRDQAREHADEQARIQMRESVADKRKSEPTWPESARLEPNPVTIVADDPWKPAPAASQPSPPPPPPPETQDDLKLILTPSDEPPQPATSLAETPDPLFADEPSMSMRAHEESRLNLDLHYDSRKEPSLADEMATDSNHDRDFAEDFTFPRTQLPPMEPTLESAPIEADDDDPAYKIDIRPSVPPAAEPAFVQRAKKQERYGRLGRMAMWLLVIGLFPALVLQTVDAFHLQIGAVFPGARPVLAQVCKVIDCQADLPAHIESVSIDSYELHSPTKGETAFTLNVLLRNRSQMAQAWPHFELTLKDATETPIVRRVFSVKEYLNSKQEITKGFAANSEYPIKLQFEVEAPLKPVGYEVYLFYS